jgi:hypothetical protein
LGARARSQTTVPRQLHWRRTRAWSAVMLRGEGHVEIHEGDDAGDVHSRRDGGAGSRDESGMG